MLRERAYRRDPEGDGGDEDDGKAGPDGRARLETPDQDEQRRQQEAHPRPDDDSVRAGEDAPGRSVQEAQVTASRLPIVRMDAGPPGNGLHDMPVSQGPTRAARGGTAPRSWRG